MSIKFRILCALGALTYCLCEPNFVEVGSRWYYIGNEEVVDKYSDWFHARSDCWKHYSQLVSVETADEMRDLQNYIIKKGYRNGSTFATSGHSFASDYPYSWEAVQEPLKYTKWAPNESVPLTRSYLSLQLIDNELYMRRSNGYDNFYICEYTPLWKGLWLELNRPISLSTLAVMFVLLGLLLLNVILKRLSRCRAEASSSDIEKVQMI